MAWFLGFEGTYQASALLTGDGLPASGAAAPLLVGVGIVAVLVAARQGVLPSRRLMLAVAVVWIVWVGIWFPANAPTLVGFDPLSEALNETAKTLWALAYLVPPEFRTS